MKKSLEEIARQDGRYSPKAFEFVYEGLEYSVKHRTQKNKHVSGQKLCEGLRQFALKKWGRLAKTVLKSMGINTTRDFGEIVYLMIEHEWMKAQPEDTIDDFNDVYDFEDAFINDFSF